MKFTKIMQANKLEDIPNIGKSIAADLRGIGFQQPQQLLTQEPLAIYLKLADQMAKRHDPCVLYTLMAARHFMDSRESLMVDVHGAGQEAACRACKQACSEIM